MKIFPTKSRHQAVKFLKRSQTYTLGYSQTSFLNKELLILVALDYKSAIRQIA